jgi:hypothetical protein
MDLTTIYQSIHLKSGLHVRVVDVQVGFDEPGGDFASEMVKDVAGDEVDPPVEFVPLR